MKSSHKHTRAYTNTYTTNIHLYSPGNIIIYTRTLSRARTLKVLGLNISSYSHAHTHSRILIHTIMIYYTEQNRNRINNFIRIFY